MNFAAVSPALAPAVLPVTDVNWRKMNARALLV